MANNNEWTAQQAIVVGGRGDDPVIVDNLGGLKRQARVWTAVLSVIMLFAALLVGATSAQMAAADDSPSPSASESSSPSASVEDSQGYITDPQNLLGDNLTKVIDAANRTKQETGVTVRLLYLESFNTTEKPEQWASQLLESLNPPANTVMLAVASHDGNLVVVVSPNSDEWLRSQSTVDQLSEAASKPLLDQQAGQGPNWSQSAIDMMDAIASAKSTATTHAVSSVSIIVMIIVFVVLIVVVLVMIFMRRKREVSEDSKQTEEVGKTRNDDAMQLDNADDGLDVTAMAPEETSEQPEGKEAQEPNPTSEASGMPAPRRGRHAAAPHDDERFKRPN
ncbi:MAG: hypothetical protein SO053_08655 [Bifidobacterium animalis]|nr:hypothetical protein [Bifidobacterium animalis]MDY5041196.1 hypothetical protein [Bifidobacterium animalis]